MLKALILLLGLLSNWCYAEDLTAPAAKNINAADLPMSLKLSCLAGLKVKGKMDRWSPVSKCPETYQVTGLGRIDLLGDHNNPILHVNDFICDDMGCKAWCIGSSCTVEARCCRVTVGSSP